MFPLDKKKSQPAEADRDFFFVTLKNAINYTPFNTCKEQIVLKHLSLIVSNDYCRLALSRPISKIAVEVATALPTRTLLLKEIAVKATARV